MKSSVTPLVEFAPALAAVVGADAVRTGDAQLDAYTADTYWPAIAARAAGTPLGRPDVVVVPRSEEDVAAVLRVAAAHAVPVVAWGGGSGTQGGAVRVNGDVLERTLNERGLMFPHYPASSEWATVGGYIAARGSGVLSTRYGKIEDLVLSLRVALASGELIDTVACPRHAVGPDLTQLFIGSEGTLGIITRATLEIVPLPAERRFITLSFPSIEAGIEAFRSTLAAGYRPSVIR